MDYTQRITNLRSDADKLRDFAARMRDRDLQAVAFHADRAADYAMAAANLYERDDVEAAALATNRHLDIISANAALRGIV